MLALPLLLWLAASDAPRPPPATAAQSVAADAERQARILGRLVRRGDTAAVDYVVRSVREGLPPPALWAFLVAAADHPQPAYAPLLRELASYRKPSFRARALLALAAIDPDEARWAALRAIDDPVLELRLLGLELCREHTTPELEEAALMLLDRDAEVAAAVRRTRLARRSRSSSPT